LDFGLLGEELFSSGWLCFMSLLRRSHGAGNWLLAVDGLRALTFFFFGGLWDCGSLLARRSSSTD